MNNKNKVKSNSSMFLGYVALNAWLFFSIILIGWIIAASFSTTPGIFSGQVLTSGFHPENYINALFTHNVAKYFMNSLIYTSVSVVGVILFAAPAAYVLARFNFKLNKTIQSLFVWAMSIPIVMIILPLFGVVTRLGIQDSRGLLIILYIGVHIPFTLFFLISFFKSISPTFEEAAAIDGCSPMMTFWKIILPLAQPAIVTVSIFNVITIWNEYFIALIFANSSEIRPVAVGLYSMIQSMRYIGDWAGMFAAVVIVFLPTLLIYVFLSKRIISGITGGGIKG